MKCPECGATLKKISGKCSECGAVIEKISDKVSSNQSKKTKLSPALTLKPEEPRKPTPALIEFPGINRNALPEWRKELSERVREKQERRAREAVLETEGIVTTAPEPTAAVSPILELLPQAELPPLNPIVEAALKRIERAHAQSSSFRHGNAALATAIAYDEDQRSLASELGSAPGAAMTEPAIEFTPDARPVEKTHNLSVVPNVPAIKEDAKATAKPKRLIGESNDPALNYLDTVPTALLVERREYVAASATLRGLAAIVDLAIVVVLTLPLLALTNFLDLDWQNWPVIAISAGSFMLIGFLYLTIVTAFSGRTPGMRLCSLRVVDARNGLIPTGGGSAGRAFIYMLSLASAGLLSLYVFLDSEKNALHDRFTRTAVIRA